MPELETPVQDSSSLVDNLMADIEEKPTAPEPPKPDATHPVKPVEASKPPESVKVAEKTPKPAEAKPVAPEKPKEPEFKTPKELRDAYNKKNQEFDEFKKLHENTKKELTDKVSALEKKKFWTPEDEKKFTALNQELEQRRGELYTRDYASSPEFKEKYEKRWQNSYQSAVGKVNGIAVKVEKDGEVTERQATEADFNRLLNAPPQEQFALARGLFGDASFYVLGEVNALKQIEREGKEAIAAKETGWKAELEQQSKSQEEYHRTLNQSREEAERELIAKHPTIFGSEGLDEAATKAYQKGQEFLSSLQDTSKMPPQERGYRAALLKTWAAAFPLENHRRRMAEAEIVTLKEKLASLGKSDPGEGLTPTGGGAPEPKGPQNTSDLSAEFDKF